MSSTRWRRRGAALVAGALCAVLAACGPADSSTGTIGSVASTAATPTATPSASTAPTSVIVAPPAAATASLSVTVSGTTVLAQVSTSTGIAAAGSVQFAVDGTTLAAVPVSAGAAAATIPTGLAAGEHTVTAEFTSDNTAQVANAVATAGFSAAKAGSSVSAGFGKDSIRYGDSVAVEITVQAPSAPGADITGHVTLLDGANVLAEGDTDASGHAVLDLLNEADPGTRTYTVNYAGGAAVEGSSTQFTAQVTQTNVDIAVSWTDGLLPGADATITADVIGTPQSPTGAATISYDGTPIANGQIDGNGKLSGTAAAVTAGDHRIQVSYAGDVRFQPTTTDATLTVKEPTANPNQAGAAAAQASNPCPAAASACVDLSNDQAWLQTGGQITYGPVPITSGASGSRTRTGMFAVFWRDKNHRSTLFNDAPMPNSVFFDGDIAFHQGSLSNQSNGCIHLSWDASETFFDTLGVGDGVYVWGAAPY